MALIDWCLSNRSGIRISEPNENMSRSYLGMAEESIRILPRVSASRIWTATVSYYIFYYSLYSLMLRIGIKCERHSCSLEFMRRFLSGLYSSQDIQSISSAFSARIDLQYFSDRAVNDRQVSRAERECKDFYVKTKTILSRITESQISGIRNSLRNRQNL